MIIEKETLKEIEKRCKGIFPRGGHPTYKEWEACIIGCNPPKTPFQQMYDMSSELKIDHTIQKYKVYGHQRIKISLTDDQKSAVHKGDMFFFDGNDLQYMCKSIYDQKEKRKQTFLERLKDRATNFIALLFAKQNTEGRYQKQYKRVH